MSNSNNNLETTLMQGKVSLKVNNETHFRILLLCLVVSYLCGAFVNDARAVASFQGLGDLPGGTFNSDARAVSPDGSIVLGSGKPASGSSAFIWTQIDGLTVQSIFPVGNFTDGSPIAVSADNLVFAGTGTSTSGSEAFRWSTADGIIGLGDLSGGIFSSQASAMSADGSVVVGKSIVGPFSTDTEAFIWTSSGGIIGLGDLPSGPFESEATGVSADGTIVVGNATIVLPGDITETPVGRAFRWTQSGGMVDLGSPAPGLTVTAAGVSSDGVVTVGHTWDGTGTADPFLWTESSGMILLPHPPQGIGETRPHAVSGNGSIIVGETFTTRSGSNELEAFLWDNVNGTRSLIVVLEDLGVDMTGWIPHSATAISDDGLTIVGWGTNPNGDTEAFIATLPEPGTLVVIALGVPALLRRRR